jgi:tetratricopeptide (TPR) repeat protein
MAERKRQKVKSKTAAPLSRRKRFVFAFVACLLPILLFTAIELSLRLFGLGGYAPMFRKLGPVPGGNLVLAAQGGAESWFIGNSERTGTSEQYTFVDPKPTNTIRIMLVGESAIQGYPQPRHLCASAFLQLMLQDASPGRKVEVINLGTTAIASFPILGILTDALNYEPDLVIVYAGNNEFFGTYGVASSGRAGTRPWMLKVNRALHSLAVVQGLHQVLHRKQPSEDRTLMEEMMAQTYIAPNGWQRRAAANNLYENIAEMIRRCHARGASVLICAPPTNERGLAPIGLDRLDSLPGPVQQEITSLLTAAETIIYAQPNRALSSLQRVLQLDPNHARAHYLVGRVLADQGKNSEALEQFVTARDLDTMPWRTTSESLNAILRAAKELNAPVCDLVKEFRDQSAGQAIGWELMDDHVHPTLHGQAILALALVKRMSGLEDKLLVTTEACARLPGWWIYANRLGTNVYDEFAAAHSMRMVFSASFMRRNNSEAFRRFDDLSSGIEKRLLPEIRDVLHEWEDTRPYAGSRCPVTAAVAQLLLKQDHYKEALALYEIAQRAVPQYTAWYLEYTYYALLCRMKLGNGIGPAENQEAHAAIEQGHFLSEHVASDTEFTKRFTGLLHLLCGEFTEAIPCLLAVRMEQTGIDRMAVDQALVVCYMQTSQLGRAREILTSGSETNPEFAQEYRALLGQLSAAEKGRTNQ